MLFAYPTQLVNRIQDEGVPEARPHLGLHPLVGASSVDLGRRLLAVGRREEENLYAVSIHMLYHQCRYLHH